MRLRSGRQPCPGTLPTLQASTPATSKTTATILNLPLELLLSIFEAQHSLRDVARLCSTCTELRSLWRSHYHAITQAILPREILCYDDARALAEAQACIDPAQIQERIDQAGLRLLTLETKLQLQHTVIWHEPRERRAVSSSTDRVSAASEEAHAVFDMKCAISNYRQTIDLVGDAGQKDPYWLHLRYLRRIYHNADEAIAVATLSIENYLPDARKPSMFIESELPQTPCLFHPKDKGLPHEVERALQCVYFVRLLVLGKFNETIDSKCRHSLETMSFTKLYAVYSLMCGGSSDELVRFFGIYEGRLFRPDLEPSITPEWIEQLDLVREIYSSRHRVFRETYDLDSLDSILAVLDRCKAGGYGGVQRPCTENGAGKDLWDAYLRERHNDSQSSSS